MKKKSNTTLQAAITDAARDVFTELRAAHPKETFYTYALYTNIEANSISATANTEEGLVRRAKHYEAEEKKGLQEYARLLRWNPADWAYHCVGEDRFEKAQELLDVQLGSDDSGADDDEKEGELRLAMFVDSLKVLDGEGFFGRGKERQKVTLLVMMGDQETKLLLKCAQKLNPPMVFKNFSKPFLRATAGKFKGIGSRKVYGSSGVSISKNNNLLACAGSSSGGWPCLFAFSLPNTKEILKLVLDELIGVNVIAVSPDGKFVFLVWVSLANEEGGIRRLDVQTKQVAWSIKGQKDAFWSCDLSPDGKVIASAGMDGTICLWNADNGELLRKMAGHKDWAQCVRFSPDGKIIASCDRDNIIYFWDPDSGKRIGQIDDSGDRIAFSPDGCLLAIATGFSKRERVVSIWDINLKKRTNRLEAVARSKFQVVQGPDDYNNCQASGIAFSPDGKFLAIQRSSPGSVVLWDWKNEIELTWMNPNYEDLDSVVFLPDGKTLAVAGRSMNGPPLLLWDFSEAL